MVRTLSDDQLADKLCQHQVDRTVLDEAARRLRGQELRELTAKNTIIEAIHQSPLIDKKNSETAERIILAVTPVKKSSARLSSLASKILHGHAYTDEDVRSLAASVLSQDETPGQCDHR